MPATVPLGDAEARHVGNRKLRERRQDRDGHRSLHCDQRGRVAHVLELRASAVELDDPFAIGVDVRRVDAEHVALGAESIHDQVVDRAAVLRAHDRVLRLALA